MKEGQCPAAFGPPTPSPHRPSPMADSPHWVNQDLDLQFQTACKLLPVPLQELTLQASSIWRMEPAVILLTILHQLAASCGRIHRLRRGFMGLACPFNVLVCSRRPMRDRFMECLAEPWLSQARLQLRYQQQKHDPKFKRIQKALSQSASPHLHPHPDKALEEDSERLHQKAPIFEQASAQPEIFVRSPLAARLLGAIPRSFDGCVMSLQGGIDPAAELLNAGRPAISALCSVLAQSWNDIELPVAPFPAKRGVIHAFWRAPMSTARQLILGRRSPWCAAPPPVLLIEQKSDPHHLDFLPEPTYHWWEKQLLGLYKRRLDFTSPLLWELTPEATQLWGNLHAELLGTEGIFVPFARTFFDWLPELMLRLALLMQILKGESAGGPHPHIGDNAMATACTLVRWLAHAHLECLKALREPPTSDEPDGTYGALGVTGDDELALESAILARLQERGPLKPRQLSRTFHNLPAYKRQAVLDRLLAQGAIRRTEDGKLALSTSKPDSAPTQDRVERPEEEILSFPLEAIWANADADKPVCIVGVMGEMNGRLYYKSADGTGIPADELRIVRGPGTPQAPDH